MKWGLEFLPHAAFEMAECQMQRVREALRNVSPCVVGLLRPSGKIFKTPGGERTSESSRQSYHVIQHSHCGRKPPKRESGSQRHPCAHSHRSSIHSH